MPSLSSSHIQILSVIRFDSEHEHDDLATRVPGCISLPDDGCGTLVLGPGWFPCQLRRRVYDEGAVMGRLDGVVGVSAGVFLAKGGVMTACMWVLSPYWYDGIVTIASLVGQ